MKLSNFTLAQNHEGAGNLDRSFLLKPEDVLPYEAYLVLKEIFGEPINDESEEYKIQWQFCLRNNEAYVEIYDWKLDSWSIAVYTEDKREETGQKVADSLFQLIKQRALHLKGKINKAANNATGHLIQNPYTLYYESANTLLDMARNCTDISDREEIEQVLKRLKDWSSQYDLCRSAFLLYIASFEGLLNLIYELYLKKNLRDERIVERLTREQIDIKLRLAPVYCECFQDNPIDHTSEEFKNFHSIINLRNDFVHANFTKSMRTPVVVEDGYTFLISPIDKSLNGIPRSFSNLQIEHIEVVKQVIETMIERLIECMKPRYRKEFRDVIDQEYINVEYEDGEIVVVR